MEGESSLILTVLKPVKIFVYDVIRDYVGYIGSCEDNLSALRESLSDLCNKKDFINKMVKVGEDKLEEITRPAASWLKDVRILAADKELMSLMYKDVGTAKFVVKLMGKKELKKLMRKDGEMQKLSVKVMNKLKEDMENSEDDQDRLIYKMVAEVVVEVMKDTTEEFKKLMKKDKKLAVIATKMLKDRDLDKLKKDDKEMEDIVEEAESVSDEDDEESHPLLEEVPQVAEDKNIVREAATKLLTPLENLLTRLGKLMNDANFKDTVPEADSVKLVLDVIDGLLLKDGGFIKKGMDEDTRHHRSCRCCASDLSYYHNRYDSYELSIAAETMAKHIENDVIKNCPPVDSVTVCIRSIDMKRSPTHFLKGLQSRDRLLQEILNLLKDDDAVGLYGMGGCGKTTLAKEVDCKCVDMLSIMVEITESPDIGRIQGTIAESIDLPLHDVQNIAQRAIKLYNRLISEKEKKILIILDNIWEKLDLDDVGIPRTCKLLLTTREKEVCRLMGVKDAYTRQVGLLDAIEGKCLFQSQAGDKGDSEEYKAVTDRLLSKCGGLPLAIVVTSNALKDKDLPYWQKFADELEKPLSFQLASGGHRETYSILSASYRIMESKEKRMFFLLCCLWSFGSNIPIKTVMRYAIGLGLFQHVNKLSEAMDQADRWADELMSSSMLLKSDSPGLFFDSPGLLKIHDVVRAFGISIAAEDDGHKFLVDAIPRWMNKETLTEYTAISLLSDNDYSSLTEMVSDKLQILLLEQTEMPYSPSSFSGRMMNLTVLYLRKMNFNPELPESIGKLVKLRSLSLEYCRLGDIKVIGELVNLSVLSLLGSRVEKLPNEIGKLINLRLLDLTDCVCKFPPDVTNILGGLFELEGLFMFGIFENHMESNKDGGKSYAPPAIEFNNLHYLNALEMHIWCAEQLSVDAQFVKNLDSFRICVKYMKYNFSYVPKVGSFRRILYVRGVDMGEHLGDKTLKALMKKADWLQLIETSNFRILFFELDEGLPELRHLEIYDAKDVAFILNLRENLLVFPKLHSLKLKYISELKGFCDGEASPGLFSNLHDLSLYSLYNLQYVLPFAPALFKLTRLQVEECRFLKFIFTDNASAQKQETNVMKLPFLKSLYLRSLNDLASLLGSENLSAIGDSVQEHQIFFNPRIEFSALEEVTLRGCNRILKLWDKELGISSLVQLEHLTIEGCESIIEVITTEGTQELENRDQIVIFPQLKDLVIESLRNLRSFYGGNCKIKFPNLKYLRLSKLDSLNEFAGSENQSFLFHKEMDFPCLEELIVSCVNDEVMGLWDWGNLEGGSTSLLNPLPVLRTLTLGKMKGCRHIPPTVCKNISFLELKMFDEELLLSLDKEGSVWTYSKLPNLKHLRVYKSDVLQDLVRSEDFEAAAALKFFEQLKTLELDDLPRLKIFPLHLFKSLCSLHLERLSWDYVFTADNFARLQDPLQHLETLTIEECKNMRVIEFSALEKVTLRGCNRILKLWDKELGISSFQRLTTIEIVSCERLSSVGPLSIFSTLVQLERLTIEDCESIIEVITTEGTQELENRDQIVIFPQLKDLDIGNLSNLRSFYGGNCKLKFPNLKYLRLSKLDSLNEFAGSENQSVLFHKEIVFSSLEEFNLIWCKKIVKLWDKDFGISSFQSLRTIRIDGCEGLLTVGPPSLFSTLVQLESLTIGSCESMHEVITTEGTEELEERDQEVIFPQLKDLEIKSSRNLKSFYGGKCKLKFPNLKTLRLSDLNCLNKFTGSEHQSVLFHKEMDFPCLEELKVSCVNDEVMGLWDWGNLEGGSTPLLNPLPVLRTLTLGKMKGCRHIPPTVCKNVSFLELQMFDEELLLSLDKEGSVWTYSQLPNWEDLRVYKSDVLQDLVRSEDFEAAAALKFFEQLKTLELDDLPRLKIFPLHLFKSLCALYLEGLSWDYIFSADAFVMLQESLQHLETLEIIDCKNMRVVIQVQDDGEGDAGLVFKFPRLKELTLHTSSVMGFSTTVNATLCLPSLEIIKFFGCDVIQHFWSGPVIAPKLKEVTVMECKTIKSVLAGNSNHMVELPSLMEVDLNGCPDLLCFSSGPFTAPNLTDV